MTRHRVARSLSLVAGLARRRGGPARLAGVARRRRRRRRAPRAAAARPGPGRPTSTIARARRSVPAGARCADSRTPRSAGAIGSSPTASRSSLPSAEPQLRARSGFRDVLPPTATGRAVGDSAADRRERVLGRRARPRARDEDRDPRRRARPVAPLLLPRRLRDACGLPEGSDRVHDREGDRRAGFPPPGLTWRNRNLPFDPVHSSHATHVSGIAAGNAGHARRGTCASPASRRARTSATTRC